MKMVSYTESAPWSRGTEMNGAAWGWQAPELLDGWSVVVTAMGSVRNRNRTLTRKPPGIWKSNKSEMASEGKFENVLI